jgi:hypothetical protein
MAVNREITTVEYGLESESLHMAEGDCLRLDVNGIPPLKDVRCIINDASRLSPLTKYLADEAEFTKIYGRILHLLKVPVLPLSIKALIHFWDPDYRCFAFGNIDMVPTIEEYSVLTEFPEDTHKVYFCHKGENTIEELTKLLGIHQMSLYREKNNSGGLRWKRLEELLIAKKSNPSAKLEGYRILALGIFGLILCPSTTGIISLEAANLFVEYEKTKINPSAAILAETFLSLNHCKKAGKGSMRCCVPLLFIWLVSHMESKTPLFRNFWWFNQKPLELFVSSEWENFSEDDWRVKLQELPQSNFIWRAPWMKNVACLMGCGKKPWVPLMGVTGYVSYAPALVARQLGGIQSIPRTLGIAQFTGIYKGVTSEILEDIKQDWKSLVLVKKETGLRSPTVSERYPKWRNGGVTRADPISKLVGTRRKRVDCEEELREQVRQLQAELKTKEELSASLERQLTEEKAARKVAEEERDVVGQDWIKVMENLEMQKTINQDVMGKAKHWEELAAKTQAALDSHMADIDEFKNQAEIEAFNTKEELRMGMHNHKIEVEALKSKLTREKLKTVQLIESRKMLEQHNQTLDTSNNFLSRNNLIHTERIKELQDQIDRAATEAHLLRVEARQVGGDIMKYRRSLDNTDLFLRAVANKGSALAPVLD